MKKTITALLACLFLSGCGDVATNPTQNAGGGREELLAPPPITADAPDEEDMARNDAPASDPAFAVDGSFNFNTASAAEMIAICKSQRVTLPPAVAANIVAYREANGPFKTEDDLAKVPGVTPQLIMQLYPQEYDNSLWFDPRVRLRYY